MSHKKIKLTKLLFKEALVDLLKDNNISQISIKKLCEKAELNRSTFYAHYIDIYDLLEEVEDDVIEEMPIISYSQSHNDKEICQFIEYIERNYDKIIILVNNCNFIQKTIDKSLQYFDSENFDQKDIELFTLMTYFYFGGLFQSLIYWSQNHQYITIKDVSKIVYSLLNEMIRIRMDHTRK